MVAPVLSIYVRLFGQTKCCQAFDRPGENGYNPVIIDKGIDTVGFDQTKYVDDYVRENYDRLSLKIPKGKKAVLQELAVKYNMTDDKGKTSVTRLLMDAVEEKYHVDLSKP